MNLLLYFVFLLHATNDKFHCQIPSQSKWLNEYNETQRKALEVEKYFKNDKFIFEISGTIEEKPENAIYNKYKNRTSVDVIEKWACNGKKQEAVLDSIDGKIVKSIEWKIENDEEKKTFYSNDKFRVEGTGEIKHEEHESEKTIKTQTPWIKRKFIENVEWEQTWNSKIPTINGELEMEETSEISIPDKQSEKFSDILIIESLEPFSLKPKNRYTISTIKNSKLDGPEQPKSSVITQKIKRWNGETLCEEKELKLTETSYYLFNDKTKAYELISYNRITDENAKNIEEKKRISSHLLETWYDLNSPPQKTSYWKESVEILKTGRTSSFTISSNGHDILPKLFDISAKNGAFTRITDYNSMGRITRFLLIYFPETQKKNQTLLDIKFDDFGNLKEIEPRERAISNLDLKRNIPLVVEKIAKIKKMESLSNQTLLPTRSPTESDFPIIDMDTSN